MTTQQIYELAIKLGINADLRGEKRVRKLLQKNKEKYEKLNSEQKKEFDKESFTNPFSDTRVLIDKPNKEIKKILTGIDIGPAEVMLAKILGCDLVISHHPIGKALADLHDVMNLQSQVLADYGMPINIAEGLMRERISEVARGISAVNHYRSVDAAKLTNLGIMCTHTIADNMAADYLDKAIKKDKPETLGEIIETIKKIPEYQEAAKRKAGPKIFVGTPESSAGKIVLTDITGGTEGAVGIYEKMAQYGFGTIIAMHTDEERRKEAQKHHINIVIAGHMSSDSLGMNLFLDELEKKGIEIVACSGLIRVNRNKSAKTMRSKIRQKK